MATELMPSDLRRICDPGSLPFETTAQATPLDHDPADRVVGQSRAVSALQFGLGIREPGFNVFVAGPPGIGKMSAVRAFLEALSAQQPPPPDLCYVNNFADAYQPIALQLPAGKGRELQQDMRRFIQQVRVEMPKAFESEEYTGKCEMLSHEIDRRRSDVLLQLSQTASKLGFGLQVSQYGIATMPLGKEGKAMNEEDFAKLTESDHERLQANLEIVQREIREAMKRVREIEREAHEKVQSLNREVAMAVVGGHTEDLIEKYDVLPDVKKYLLAVQQDILDNTDIFRTTLDAREDGSVEATLAAPWLRELPFRKYAVNVLVDNSAQSGAPLVVEFNPSYNNLFGRIEKETQFGALYTDFTLIRAGSLHRANGGYLVLQIEEVLREGYSWEGLKRSLRAGQLQFEELAERFGFMSAKSLRPQPVPLDFKVILVGRASYYQLLLAYDPDFAELFKVRADFDTCVPMSAENIERFISLLFTQCEKEQLHHLDRAAVARLIEHAMRLAEDQTKFSTQFGLLIDILREAHYWSVQDQSEVIGRAHVDKALDQRVYRSSLMQDRLREMIARGMLLIDTRGATAGQINGLSVINMGDYAFGQPSRITASVEPGRAGVINIEREVEMSGPIFNKGVLILAGYMAYQYGHDKPVTLSARLVFEQNYEGVEGDSASSTELYALLSALSGLPIKQGIAVTGSVNQHGGVQVIGGVNEKIEGFFDICRAQGFTGEQGVLIPAGNGQNLMLRNDIVDAVQHGQFHVWAVKHVDEGIEVLTGVCADEVHRMVLARLREIDKRLQETSDHHRRHVTLSTL